MSDRALELIGQITRIGPKSDSRDRYPIVLRSSSKDEVVALLAVKPNLRTGQLVRISGHWVSSEGLGACFMADSYQLIANPGKDGMRQFLSSGAIRGVGAKMAKRLVDYFGEELSFILDHHADRLKELDGIAGKTAKKIKDDWDRESQNRDIMIFLQEFDVSPHRARAILDQLGKHAVIKLLRDPYIVAREVRGMGFAKADQLSSRLGVERQSLVRKEAALMEVLSKAADMGHTAMPEDQTLRQAASLTSLHIRDYGEAFSSAIEKDRIRRCETKDGSLIQLKELSEAEKSIARQVKTRLKMQASWSCEKDISSIEEKLGLQLDETQRDAALATTKHGFAIVTGGAGTGKTTMLRTILAFRRDDNSDIVLCAPTGRAARRMSTATGEQAMTIHRLLEADPQHGFGRDQERPVEADLVIVDECSMVDTYLMAALLNALSPKAAIILCGDARQLPPVGPGSPFQDLIAMEEIPVYTLSKVHRQALQSSIIVNAHKILEGQKPDLKSHSSKDCFGIRASDPETARSTLVELVQKKLPERFGFDPMKEIQVLSPVRQGALGVIQINKMLQKTLNEKIGAGMVKNDQLFAPGDKVMQTENDNSREIYNGDIGYVREVDQKNSIIDVRYEDKSILYTNDNIHQLSLAYAITVHKAQGSEYPCVILLLTREHGRMLNREILYTAITRAQKLLIAITQDEALLRTVGTITPKRRTLLSSYFKELEQERA